MNKLIEADKYDPLGRRRFIKGVSAGIALMWLGLPLGCADNKARFVYPEFKVGLHNAHILDAINLYLPVEVRFPLRRAAFDQGGKKIDPFYDQRKRLLAFKKKGSHITMVLEIHPEDDNKKLARMFDTAQEAIVFQKGDSVVLGNEVNIEKTQYPPDVYARQAKFLQKHITETVKDIKIGLAGEAMDGNGDFLKDVLKKDPPFDFLPIHSYSTPQFLAQRVALYRRILTFYGLSQTSISIGEAGVTDRAYPQDNPKGFLSAGQVGMASAVYKLLCFAKASGCSSLNIYSALDTFNGGYMERFGLVDSRWQPRKSLEAFTNAQQIFNLASTISWEYTGGFYVFRLRGSNFETEISWFAPDPNSLGDKVSVKNLQTYNLPLKSS